MAKTRYIYDIDDHLPARLALLYGFQWAIITFPSFVIMATLTGHALGMSLSQEVRFLQLTLLTSGIFSAAQTLWGHRYPLVDGPSTALLLTLIILAPYGIEVIQGGTIFGGALLIALVLSRQLKRAVAFATPNVVGVILILIAFTLLPYLTRTMTGAAADHPHGELQVFLISLSLVLAMAALSHRLTGFWKTLALLLGMLIGTVLFSFLGLLDWHQLVSAPWASIPKRWTAGMPSFFWPGLVAFASAYLALLVNSLGSLHGIANITDTARLPAAISRGIFFNGLGGFVCGLLGTVGMVSYSLSPGVVLANRVASRYTITYCGVILVVAAFAPKLAALLALVPAPVVGAVLCVAMGAQIGAGLSIIDAGGITGRDYYVVGVPLLLGTMVGYFPESFVADMHAGFRIFLANGLIVGIFLVLLLEHVLLRKKPVQQESEL
ncbi:MAG: solute carrier family 23 protein [Desulforhabdus sp.]|jgi:uracil permease|nr:solute carrier family 23 protein [Desulforhabdus sp.]